MKLIVGLGNPGKQYTHTKHNIGFAVLDSYAEANKIKYKKSIRFTSEISKTDKAIFLKPKTYMNNSGLSVKKVAEYYHIDSQDILVIFDDLNLPFNKLRLRPNGSAGGHNGIKSMISHLKTEDFKRLRVGIGRNQNHEMKDDVLSPFSKSELRELEDTKILINDIIDLFVEDQNFENIMTKYN